MSSARPILMVMAMLAFAMPVHAAQTPAGTVIDNTATLSYSVTGGPLESVPTNNASFQVIELIGARVVWQDAAPVSVDSPSLGKVLSFVLTNPGNGSESYALTRNNAPAVTDDYDPISSATPIYLESNGIPGLQTGAGGDTPYAGNISLTAEESRVIYLVSDTAAALAVGSRGEVALTAASVTPGAAGAAPGTELPGLGDGGIAAVVGSTRAQSTDNGIHVVGGLSVTLAKTASVVGGGDAAPGKTLTYTLTVNINGSGTASKLVISDPLPAELTYLANSIAVDAASRTDAADGDNAQFSGNSLSVDFGDVAAPATHVISFSATVN